VHDPDYVGNAVVAKDINGTTVDSVAVAGDGMPFVPSSAPATVTGTGIRSIELIPAPADFVTYDGASFVTPRFNLSCTQVTRGASTTCTATSNTGSAAMSVASWRFSNTDGDLHVIVNRTSTDTTWSGVVALGGQIEIFGHVGGVPDTGSATLTVDDRNWSGDTVLFQIDSLGNGELFDPPIHWFELGNTAQSFGLSTSGSLSTSITGGPNDSLRYWNSVPVLGLSQISINYAALSVNSFFYQQQPVTPYWPDECAQQDVVPFIPVAEAHEGTQLQAKSHTYYFRHFLNQLTVPLVETIAAKGDNEDLRNVTWYAMFASAALARSKADDAPVGLTPRIEYCEFTW
jgi:hypothetical protein